MGLTKVLQKMEIALGVACLGGMFLVICANVVMRYLATDPIFWAEEVSNFLFVWAGFLSCAYVLADGRHIRVTLFVGLLPPAARQWISLLMAVVLVVVFGSFIWPSLISLKSMNVTAALQMPEAYPYAVLPITMTLCCVHAAVRALNIVREIRGAGEEGAP